MHSQGFFMIQTTCPQCRGEGVTISDPCTSCRGSGLQAQTSSLTVTVPPGVDDRQTLRLPGKGEAPPNHRPGHLFVILRVKPDKRFVREEENILTEVPISYIRAALGGKAEVPTLDDECQGSTEVEIKPGTQPGAVLVRRGEGIPRLDGRGRGDHVVQFKVGIPTKLSRKARELLHELAKETGEDLDDPKPPKSGLFGWLK
jgi:molecular chaperone DnaJ